MEKEIQKITELWKQIIEFYRKNYGWDIYYIHNDWTNDYAGHIMRIYMSTEWDHTNFEYKKIEVSYFDTPQITFPINITKKDFLQHIKEIEDLFSLIKKQREDVDDKELERARLSKIKNLKHQLSELEK